MTLKSIASALVSVEIWPALLAVALGIAFPALLPYSLLVLLLFWPLRWLAHGSLSVRTPVDFPILLLALLLPVTLWATARPDITHPQVYRLAVGVGTFYAIANWANSQFRLRVLLIGVALLLSALALLAPFGIEWGISKYNLIPISLYARFPLLLSDTINPNVMAGILVLIMPVLIAALIFAWRELLPYPRVVAIVALVLGAVALLLTQSRGAWLALLICIGLLLVLAWRWGWLIIAGLGLVSLAAIIFLGPSSSVDVLMGGGQLQNIEGRLEVWSRALYMIEDFSLTGVGIGMYMHVADLLYPFFLFAPGQIEHAHNLFLQVAVDLGLPGLIAWLAVFLGLAYSAGRLFYTARRDADRLYTALGAGLLASLLALLVHGLVDAVTWGMVRHAPLVWGLWGFVAASANLYSTGRQV